MFHFWRTFSLSASEISENLRRKGQFFLSRQTNPQSSNVPNLNRKEVGEKTSSGRTWDHEEDLKKDKSASLRKTFNFISRSKLCNGTGGRIASQMAERAWRSDCEKPWLKLSCFALHLSKGLPLVSSPPLLPPIIFLSTLLSAFRSSLPLSSFLLYTHTHIYIGHAQSLLIFNHFFFWIFSAKTLWGYLRRFLKRWVIRKTKKGKPKKRLKEFVSILSF